MYLYLFRTILLANNYLEFPVAKHYSIIHFVATEPPQYIHAPIICTLAFSQRFINK